MYDIAYFAFTPGWDRPSRASAVLKRLSKYKTIALTTHKSHNLKPFDYFGIETWSACCNGMNPDVVTGALKPKVLIFDTEPCGPQAAFLDYAKRPDVRSILIANEKTEFNLVSPTFFDRIFYTGAPGTSPLEETTMIDPVVTFDSGDPQVMSRAEARRYLHSDPGYPTILAIDPVWRPLVVSRPVLTLLTTHNLPVDVRVCALYPAMRIMAGADLIVGTSGKMLEAEANALEIPLVQLPINATNDNYPNLLLELEESCVLEGVNTEWRNGATTVAAAAEELLMELAQDSADTCQQENFGSYGGQ